MIPMLTIDSLTSQYGSGELTPVQLVESIQKTVEEYSDRNIWIALTPSDALIKQAAVIQERWGALSPEERKQQAPLYGIPFAVKDNIDVKGFETTAGCPGYAYAPERSAPVVDLLLEAGAMLIGKTNMDQFATGLVGTRSPYGQCKNAINPDYVSGGSSSGSAVAVALNMASFSLGTDTAGSGRVPAAFNNIVGFKPTRGIIPCTGVVPACKSLDCLSIFAQSVADATQVLTVVGKTDPEDPYSRPVPESWQRWDGGLFTFGVPSELDFLGNEEYRALFEDSVERLTAMGGTMVEVDYTPFAQAAELLYGGPWVAERYAAIGAFMESGGDGIDPVVEQIVAGGKKYSAVELFQGEYRRQELKKKIANVFGVIDVLLLPTAPTHYTLAEIAENPIAANTNLGKYTNFMNMMDLSAIAIPAGMTSQDMPFGVTLAAPAFSDMFLADMARLFLGDATSDLEYTGQNTETIPLAVVGAHLSGLSLNYQLTERNATLIKKCKTAPKYRLYSLPGTAPRKPGLIRVEEGGLSIEVEVWEMPVDGLGSFTAGVPAPLGIGNTELDSGEIVKGFICEPYVIEAAQDITEYGGFKAFLETLAGK